MHLESIADHLDLVDLIARWHFAEWGHLDPSSTLEAWTEGLRQRTHRDEIPTTYVALEADELLGSVTLVEHDMLTRPELSPWVAGVYVAPAHRHRGIGSALVRYAVHQVVKSTKSEQVLRRRVSNRREHYSRTSQPSNKSV